MAYTPPIGNNVNFVMVSGYTSPMGDAVNFEDTESSDNSSLSDMALDIAVFSNAIDNTFMDIEAAYQFTTACPIDMCVLSEISFDNMLDVGIAYQVLYDVPVSVNLANEIYWNVSMCISLSSGVITQAIAMDISVGDGAQIQSVGMDLMAVSTLPEFKSIYAMHLNSAIKEVT